MTELETKYAQAEAKRIQLKNELESRDMTGDEWIKVSGEFMNASRRCPFLTAFFRLVARPLALR